MMPRQARGRNGAQKSLLLWQARQYTAVTDKQLQGLRERCCVSRRLKCRPALEPDLPTRTAQAAQYLKLKFASHV